MSRIARTWTAMRRVTKVNLIIGSALVLVFAYVGLTVYFGAASQVRYDSNDFPGAKKAATAFLTLSPIERHIGYYNRGTAEAAVGQFEPAQSDLESALEITPARDECAVRVNLSYVYEKLADEVADQDPEQSDELYDRSLKTLEDAPEECRPPKSEEQQKSDEAKERVEDKKDGQQSKNEGSEGDESDGEDSNGEDSKDDSDEDKKDDDQGQSSDEDDENSEDSGGKSESEKKREELEKRGEDSDRQQRQQGPGGEGGRTSPDKPW